MDRRKYVILSYYQRKWELTYSSKKTLNELEMKCEPCSVMGNQKWEETGERRPERRSQEVLIIEDR
jgi:hypothetical protein